MQNSGLTQQAMLKTNCRWAADTESNFRTFLFFSRDFDAFPNIQLFLHYKLVLRQQPRRTREVAGEGAAAEEAQARLFAGGARAAQAEGHLQGSGARETGGRKSIGHEPGEYVSGVIEKC